MTHDTTHQMHIAGIMDMPPLVEIRFKDESISESMSVGVMRKKRNPLRSAHKEEKCVV